MLILSSIVALQLLYRWRHQSRKLCISFVEPLSGTPMCVPANSLQLARNGNTSKPSTCKVKRNLQKNFSLRDSFYVRNFVHHTSCDVQFSRQASLPNGESCQMINPWMARSLRWLLWTVIHYHRLRLSTKVSGKIAHLQEVDVHIHRIASFGDGPLVTCAPRVVLWCNWWSCSTSMTVGWNSPISYFLSTETLLQSWKHVSASMTSSGIP
jgi:hypothetical protein